MHLPLSIEPATTEPPDAARPTARRLDRWRRPWPVRRVVVAALLTVPLGAVLADAGGGWAPGDLPLWSALVAAAALLGAATLATYVPAPGMSWRLDLGCAPCSAASGLTVLAADWLLALGPHQASMALVAVIVVVAGLVQRLTSDASSCATGSR